MSEGAPPEPGPWFLNTLHRTLVQGPCILLDGGLGTALLARGLPAGSPPEAWNVERPFEVRAAHQVYVDAGSEAVHANSFGANRVRLTRFGWGERCAEVNAAAVRLAREAGAHFVIGDVGPTGEYLPPVGHGDPAVWRAAYEQQGRLLAEAGVDCFHIETMTDLREARIALQALRSVAPNVPIMASLTFERRKRGFFTIMGDPLLPSLLELAEAGAAAVGANCTLSSPDMRELALEALAGLDLPLVIQPNAGQPRIEGAVLQYSQTPGDFARDLAPLAAPRAERRGLAALGGCCGTDARFIAALNAAFTQES